MLLGQTPALGRESRASSYAGGQGPRGHSGGLPSRGGGGPARFPAPRSRPLGPTAAQAGAGSPSGRARHTHDRPFPRTKRTNSAAPAPRRTSQPAQQTAGGPASPRAGERTARPGPPAPCPREPGRGAPWRSAAAGPLPAGGGAVRPPPAPVGPQPPRPRPGNEARDPRCTPPPRRAAGASAPSP